MPQKGDTDNNSDPELKDKLHYSQNTTSLQKKTCRTLPVPLLWSSSAKRL